MLGSFIIRLEVRNTFLNVEEVGEATTSSKCRSMSESAKYNDKRHHIHYVCGDNFDAMVNAGMPHDSDVMCRTPSEMMDGPCDWNVFFHGASPASGSLEEVGTNNSPPLDSAPSVATMPPPCDPNPFLNNVGFKELTARPHIVPAPNQTNTKRRSNSQWHIKGEVGQLQYEGGAYIQVPSCENAFHLRGEQTHQADDPVALRDAAPPIKKSQKQIGIEPCGPDESPVKYQWVCQAVDGNTNCWPCHWHSKPVGCWWGAACHFCHACGGNDDTWSSKARQRRSQRGARSQHPVTENTRSNR